MYYIFGHELPHINSNATPTQITEWKKHPSVKKCYRKLFQKITLGEPDTFMTRIIDKVWQEKKNVAKVKIAYVISICENMLNPNNHYIQVSEKLVKAKKMKEREEKEDDSSYYDYGEHGENNEGYLSEEENLKKLRFKYKGY